MDVEKWLDETLAGEELTADERKTILARFQKPDVMKRIEADGMRQVDYSKRMDEFSAERKKAEEELAAERKKLQSKWTELGDWEEQTKQTVDKLQKRVTELQSSTVTYEQAMKKASKEFGFDVKEYLDENAIVPARRPATGGGEEGPDLSRFVTKDDIKKILAEVNQVYGQYPVGLMTIAAKHQALTGKPLVEIDEIYAEHQKTGKAIDEIYDARFKPGEIIAKRQQEEFDKKLAAARAEGVQEGIKRATAMPDSVNPEDYASPALRLTAKTPDGERKLTAVERAVQAHAAHKYAKPGSPHYRPPAT